MIPSYSKTDPSWKSRALNALLAEGYCVIQDVLDHAFLKATRTAMYRAQEAIRREVGDERLRRAGEIGVLRLMLKYEPHFLRFLEIPELLAMIDATVSETAIMHLQNGFILPSFEGSAGAPKVFQNTYHRDFPRYLNGYMASLNVFFAIDEFRADNGSTWVVPGTHQKAAAPTPEFCEVHAVPATCVAGSMIVFDSTLWHAAGQNVSGQDRLAINHQFTRSFIKQQIDYVRAMDEAQLRALPARSQQLLGYYTRVVTSLDEYYRPESQRLYRKGQG
jgi:ectoine hydroxylase-related dioxygenase (phytanoyl-CoA dioxygenase family)